jgi:Schlafen, AlbA_2
MPGKMAKSAPRPAFGLPEGPVAVCTSRRSCRTPKKRENSHQFRGHLGNPGLRLSLSRKILPFRVPEETMPKLETRAQLEALHSGLIKESLTLEYKSSGAVDKTQSKKDEMAKDALAFANATGGQIVYGMKEKDNLPHGLDGGIDPLQFPGIWFEQVIQQSVSPQIEGLRIQEVPLEDGTGRVAVVVTIPAAQARAPHQAKDGRYYRRHNFRNQIMDDYEVRDMMRRATTPEPFVGLSFAGGMNASIEYAHESEISKPIILKAFIGNRSRQPAYHTLILFGIDTDIQILTHEDSFVPVGERTDPDGIPQNWIILAKTTPPNMPIFQEAYFILTDTLALGFHSRLLRGEHRFRVTTTVQTPGFAATEYWTILLRGNTLRLLEPGH